MFFPITGDGIGAFIGEGLQRTAVGALVGGGISAVMGGSFGEGAAMGARTSAIGYLCNDWLHDIAGKLDFVNKGEDLAKQAFEDAKSSPLQGNSSGPQDAYRHARWNELMREEMGAWKAFLVSMSHEIFDNQVTGEQSWNDFRMDSHNNFQGAFSEKDAMTLYGEGKLKVLETPYSKYDSGY